MAGAVHTEPNRATAEDPSFSLASWRRRAVGWLINWLAPFWLANLLLNYLLYGQRETQSQANNTMVWSFLVVCVLMGVLSRRGQMLGHIVMHLQVVDESGEPISRARQIGRNLAHILDWLTIGIGWLLPLWDRRGQTLADKIAKTYVADSPLSKAPIHRS